MRLIEPEELAAEWKVPMSWIYGKCRERALPHIKVGHFIRFDEATLVEWLNQHRRAVKPRNLVQEERAGAMKASEG